MLWWRFLLTNALRNLMRSPGRTLFSVLSIASAATSLVMFRSFVDGVKTRFRHNIIASGAGHYQLYTKGYRQNKGESPYDYPIRGEGNLRADIERQVGKLAMYSHRQEFSALLSVGERTLGAKGFGIDAEEEEKFFSMYRVESGSHLARQPANSIFLGSGLARQLKVAANSPLTLLLTTAKGSLNAMDMTVAGIFRTGISEIDDNIFYVHEPAALSLLRLENGSQIMLGFAGDDELKYRPALDALLRDHYPTIEAVHWHELLGELFDSQMSWLESMFAIFRLIVLLIVMLSIVNIFSVTLLERTGEFGTLRAIGTQRGELLWLVMAEALMQSFLGGLFGLLAAIALILFPLRQGISLPPPTNMNLPFLVQFAVPWREMAVTLVFCLGISLCAAIVPAIRTARLNIVQALGRNV
jgi:putative ABC transport system permease protein